GQDARYHLAGRVLRRLRMDGAPGRLAALRGGKLGRVRPLDVRAPTSFASAASALSGRRRRARRRASSHAGPESETYVVYRRTAVGHRRADGRRHRLRATADRYPERTRPGVDGTSLPVPALRRHTGGLRASFPWTSGSDRGAERTPPRALRLWGLLPRALGAHRAGWDRPGVHGSHRRGAFH